MKYLDVLAAVLLVIGGLNWGLWGLLELDLVSSAFGLRTALSVAVYGLVGLAALYQAFSWRAIQRRWNVAPVLVTSRV